MAILSGGNIDPTVLISVMRHGLTTAGRYLVVRSRLDDRPGELIKLLKLVAQERANVISVDHHREGMAVPVYQSEIELTLAMRDEHHCSVLLETLRSLGYQVERLRSDDRLRRLRAREPDEARYCLACGALQPGPARGAQGRLVLFADLVGFTSRAESLDPEDVRGDPRARTTTACAPSWSAAAARSRSSSATR